MAKDRENFQPNNILLTLTGTGFLWMGWTGFNGGAPYAASLDASIAVYNTHLCTATSLLVWLSLDMFAFTKPSVTGLVCITPAAGLVQPWAAIVMGLLSGSIPWLTMMVLHKRSRFLKKVDDTLAIFYTHAIAGSLGGILTGILADPNLNHLFLIRRRPQVHRPRLRHQDGPRRNRFPADRHAVHRHRVRGFGQRSCHQRDMLADQACGAAKVKRGGDTGRRRRHPRRGRLRRVGRRRDLRQVDSWTGEFCSSQERGNGMRRLIN
ncbi:ammonium transporter 3 member 1-like [Canna indica]|uniref:Ammonium transporter 3 member 1-like n=1 Tax=Canna indica TaxID=4628 RepID=A0AAQ3QN74_9LILI|nr:ammonium transporter 3 member 1-like [Canna indica]